LFVSVIIEATLRHDFETRGLFHPLNDLVIRLELVFATLAELPILRVLFALGNHHLFGRLSVETFQTLSHLVVVRRFASFLQTVASIA